MTGRPRRIAFLAALVMAGLGSCSPAARIAPVVCPLASSV